MPEVEHYVKITVIQYATGLVTDIAKCPTQVARCAARASAPRSVRSDTRLSSTVMLCPSRAGLIVSSIGMQCVSCA